MCLKRLIPGLFLTLMAIIPANVHAETVANVPPSYPVTCVGRPDAPHRAIFLHGMRPAKTPPQAAGHVAQLTAFANDMNYRIAIPQSTTPCIERRDIFCWRGDRKEGVEKTWRVIVKSAAACFEPQAGFGVIGFSNGGYHVAKVVMKGLRPAPQWAVAIGSAGTVANLAAPDLSAAPHFALLIGTHDVTRHETARFARLLKPTKLPVEIISFNGGHEVPFALLRTVVGRLQKPDAVARAATAAPAKG